MPYPSRLHFSRQQHSLVGGFDNWDNKHAPNIQSYDWVPQPQQPQTSRLSWLAFEQTAKVQVNFLTNHAQPEPKQVSAVLVNDSERIEGAKWLIDRVA